MQQNSIGRIVARLGLAKSARILDVGGAPFRGEESIDYLLDATDQAIDAVAGRPDQAGVIRDKYGARVRVFSSVDELDCCSYDLIVLTANLGQIAHNFRTMLPFEYAGLVRVGGFVVTLGIDAKRAAAADAAGVADQLALLDQEFDLRAVKKRPEVARGCFRYLCHELRKPSTGSYFLWVALQRTDKPVPGQSDTPKWWRSLRLGDSRVLAASASFVESFYDRFDSAPASAFELLPPDERVAPESIHHALMALFNGRRMADYAAALLQLTTKGYGDLLLFHRLTLDKYEGDFRCDLSQALARYRSLPEHAFLKRPFLCVLIDQAARSLGRDTLLQLLQIEPAECLNALPRSIMIGVCRALDTLGLLDECRSLMDAYLAGRPEILQMQFFEIRHHLAAQRGADAAEGALPYYGWRSVLQRLCAERAAALNGGVGALERATYSALDSIPEGSDDLVDVRFFDDQRRLLKQIIARAVVARRPLSLVRLGDGEAYAFAYAAHDFTDSGYAFADAACAFAGSGRDTTLKELIWWGRHPDDRRRAEIRSRVRDAVDDADILGIPSVHRLLREIGDPATPYESSNTLTDLAAVLKGIHQRGLLSKRVITEERCHQLIFDREYLAELTRAANRTVWVTCWGSAQLGVEHASDQVFVTIPAHSKTRDFGNTEAPLCDVFEKQIAQMCQAISVGTVVFVAAGIIGKIFIFEAKKRGAVALDVGAMADYLAGRKTRSSADLI